MSSIRSFSTQCSKEAQASPPFQRFKEAIASLESRMDSVEGMLTIQSGSDTSRIVSIDEIIGRIRLCEKKLVDHMKKSDNLSLETVESAARIQRLHGVVTHLPEELEYVRSTLSVLKQFSENLKALGSTSAPIDPSTAVDDTPRLVARQVHIDKQVQQLQTHIDTYLVQVHSRVQQLSERFLSLKQLEQMGQ